MISICVDCDCDLKRSGVRKEEMFKFVGCVGC